MPFLFPLCCRRLSALLSLGLTGDTSTLPCWCQPRGAELNPGTRPGGTGCIIPSSSLTFDTFSTMRPQLVQTYRYAHVWHCDDVSVLHQVDWCILNVEPTIRLIVAVVCEVGRVPEAAAAAPISRSSSSQRSRGGVGSDSSSIQQERRQGRQQQEGWTNMGPTQVWGQCNAALANYQCKSLRWFMHTKSVNQD